MCDADRQERILRRRKLTFFAHYVCKPETAPGKLVDAGVPFDGTQLRFGHHTPTITALAHAREKRPQLAAETERHHREPDNECGDTHRGDADLFPHGVRLTAHEGRSALIRAYNWV